jgi:FMN phosphatase YigB (HAD superfamily)
MSSFLQRDKIEIVFVDWFGVLSTNYYWCVQSKRSSELKAWCDLVFDDEVVMKEWMRGDQSIQSLAQLGPRLGVDSIVSSFLNDMEYYAPDEVLMKAINDLFPGAQKMLVTDNFELFEQIRKEYPILDRYFSRTYVSYATRRLKGDKPPSMFDIILTDLGRVNFKRCVLVDDSPINCGEFQRRGGHTLLVS